VIIISWVVIVAMIGTWMPLRRRFDPRMHDIFVAVVLVPISFLNAGMNISELAVSSVAGTIGTICGWRALRGTST
jgi:hypothetical protein